MVAMVEIVATEAMVKMVDSAGMVATAVAYGEESECRQAVLTPSSFPSRRFYLRLFFRLFF
jgi:hypothetical protein